MVFPLPAAPRISRKPVPASRRITSCSAVGLMSCSTRMNKTQRARLVLRSVAGGPCDVCSLRWHGPRQQFPLIADNPGDLLGKVLPALNAKSPATCFTITNAIERAKRNDLPLEKLRLMRDETRPDTEMGPSPWSAGYALARQLRQNLELGDDPIPTMNGLAEAIGEDVALLRKATRPSGCLAETPMVDGVVTRNANENPAFAFRRHGEAGRRFHLCRALAEVWMSPGSDALLTRAYSESQQRNRAFAAEFLAPSSGLRSRVSGSVVDGEDLDGLAVEYGVSSQVVEHQIANHHIARISRVGAPSD